MIEIRNERLGEEGGGWKGNVFFSKAAKAWVDLAERRAAAKKEGKGRERVGRVDATRFN